MFVMHIFHFCFDKKKLLPVVVAAVEDDEEVESDGYAALSAVQLLVGNVGGDEVGKNGVGGVQRRLLRWMQGDDTLHAMLVGGDLKTDGLRLRRHLQV